MMDKSGIRAAVLDRLKAMEASCNSTHLVHNDGVVRGLLWALTGVDPGSSCTVQHALDLAGFKTRLEGDRVEYEEAT